MIINSIFIFTTTLVFLTTPLTTFANEEHDHHNHEHEPKKPKSQLKNDDHQTHDESKHHGEHEKHEDGDSHEEHEVNSQVGVNKGILEANESEGIKLSPQAEKNFEIDRLKVSPAGTIIIPKNAVVTATAEVNVFRFRNGFYKRIDFEKLSNTQENLQIKSIDLRPGDEVVVRGMGFLRLAEIAAFGGAPEGHSH